MKKFFILALALTFVAGFAYAEDAKYSLGGQYRWEMYQKNNEGYLDEDANKQEYFDQRFRLQMTFDPADGVQAVLRGDYAETNWGSYDYRPDPGHETIMIDKAYVQLTKGALTLKTGLYGFGGFGNAMSTDYQGTAATVTGSFEPITVTAVWVKLDEGTSTADIEDGDPSEDTDLMGAQVDFGAEAFSAGVFYATLTDKVDEYTGNVIGVLGSTSLGKISLWGEVDMYSGTDKDAAADGGDLDFSGTNLAVNAEMGVNEQLTVGLDVFYATGVDSSDGDEAQLSFLADDWGYVPLDHGPFKWIQTTGINVHEVEANAGSQGLNVYGTFMAMEELALFANVGYVSPQLEDPDDDDVYVSSYTVFSVAASYTFLPGTSFNLKYDNISRSGEEIDDDARSRIMGMVKVNF